MEDDGIVSENINDFVPSILHPRAVRRSNDPNLTQLSVASKFSLSLKKKNRLPLMEITQNQNLMKMESTGNIFKPSNYKNSSFENLSDINNVDSQRSCLDSICNATTEKSYPELGKNESCTYLQKLCSKSTLSALNCDSKGSDKPLLDGNRTNARCTYQEEDKNDCNLSSIHSCETLLYDPSETELMHAPINSHIETCSQHNAGEVASDKVIINVSLTNEAVSKRRSSLKYEGNKKIKGSEDLMLVLSKKTVRKYSKIVIEPPKLKMFKKKSNKFTLPKNQKKITRFFKNILVTKSISRCAANEDDCIFVGEETAQHCSKICIKEVSANQNYSSCSESREPSNSKATTRPLSPIISKGVTKAATTIPPYKTIPGTEFAVDAFRYGCIPGVSTYFLTHFHSDHYAGLGRSFSRTLYCTNITAELCRRRLGVDPSRIRIIEPDQTLTIHNVRVTALDANHCPGSIMLVFERARGGAVLHCGDCRASFHMESCPIFWNIDIATVYLDTTYCWPRRELPTQDESIATATRLLDDARAELRRRGRACSSLLVVCGTYTIGKERFWQGVAAHLGCSVWAPPHKAAALRIALGRDVITHAPQHSQLHLLDMRLINHQDLRHHVESVGGGWGQVVAFRPSGWQVGAAPHTQHNITIHGVAYSEHSSWSEALRLVRFLRPRLVIPTMPASLPLRALQKHFPCPLSYKEDSAQKKISDYFGSGET